MKTIIPVLACLLFTGLHSNAIGEEPLLRNGSFDEGANNWFVLVGGVYHPDEKLGEAQKVHPGRGLWLNVAALVDAGDPKPADLSLNQRVKTLKDGEAYLLRFEVRASQPGILLAALGNPVTSGPHKFNLSGGVPLREVEVGPEWRTVEIAFTYNQDQSLDLPADAEETVLQFRAGSLRDLAVRKVSLTTAGTLP